MNFCLPVLKAFVFEKVFAYFLCYIYFCSVSESSPMLPISWRFEISS